MKAFAFIRQYSFAKYIMVDLARSFRDLGWSIQWVDLEDRVRLEKEAESGGMEIMVRRLCRDAEAFDPDVVLTYGLEYVCDGAQVFGPGFQRSLSDLLERPAVHFVFDFGSPFDKERADEIEPEFLRGLQNPGHIFFCWDKEAVYRMKTFGLTKSFYFPMAVNPEAFHPLDSESPSLGPCRRNIVFAGGPTPERISHLACLADLGLTIYGYGEQEWKAHPRLAPCWRPPIKERERLNQCYNASKISVNVTRPHGFTSLNMRVYEAMAAGSLMLTDEKSDAHELFEEDREIVLYRSLDELKEKAVWYLSHEEERRRIAEAGMRRVLRDHTYQARVKTILPVIEQFYREYLLLKKISDLAAGDPEQVFQLLSQTNIAETIRLNMDTYTFLLASLAKKTGRTQLANEYNRMALETNPYHLLASEMIRP